MRHSKTIKRLRRKFIYGALSVANKLMPKLDRVFVYGGGVLNDNTEALYEYLCSRREVEVVCMADTHRDFHARGGVRYVDNSNLAAAWYLLTSRVSIDSFLHAVRLRPTKGQLFIQLWHGSPLKSIGHASVEKNAQYYTSIAYPSEFFKDAFAQAFGATDAKLLLCGNPRNDLLLEPELGRFGRIDADLRVMWMPTFRHGLGMEETKRDIPVVDESNVHELDRFLVGRGICLYVKPHPLQTVGFERLFEGCANVKLVTDDSLREDGIPLYRFLGAMDILLTDYSSVYFDYLLLDRPIGFVIDDFEEYESNRGFTFDDPTSMMPGPVLPTMGDLIDFLDTVAVEDAYAEKRRLVNELANYYRDGRNRERVAGLIERFLSERQSSRTSGGEA